MVIPPFKKYRNKFEYILYTRAAYKNGFLIAPWLLPSHFHSHFHPQTIILKAIHQSLHQPVSRKQRPQAYIPICLATRNPLSLTAKSRLVFLSQNCTHVNGYWYGGHALAKKCIWKPNSIWRFGTLTICMASRRKHRWITEEKYK